MFNLILLIIFAMGFGYFATFNTLSVHVVIGPYYTFPSVPLYLVVGITLLIGLLISWFISILRSFANSMTLSRVKHEVTDNKSTIHEMTKTINKLQIENASLKGELKNEPLEDNSL